jgi:hypothetical protein
MNQISFQNAYQTSTAPAFAIGQRASTPDGRDWVYVKASAAVSANQVVVPAATTSVAATITSSTDALGRIVYITKASAGWTAGQFADGWVHIDGGTGSGQTAKVITNSNDTLTLAPETALTTALSTDSTMEIWTQFLVRKSLVTSKIQNATGVAQVAFASGDYGFVLTRGQGAVIAGEVLVVGGSFVTGDDTAGEVVKGTTAKGAFDEQTIGVCINPNSGADLAALVFVTLDA